MRNARTTSGHTRIARHLAGLIAFVFALVSVVASQHQHHRTAGLPAAGTSAAFAAAVVAADTLAADAAVSPQSDPARHCDLHISGADCATCAWLSTGVTTPGVAPTLVAAALSGIVALLLLVRFAALCAAPAPRRGMRAPPLALA